MPHHSPLAAFNSSLHRYYDYDRLLLLVVFVLLLASLTVNAYLVCKLAILKNQLYLLKKTVTATFSDYANHAAIKNKICQSSVTASTLCHSSVTAKFYENDKQVTLGVPTLKYQQSMFTYWPSLSLGNVQAMYHMSTRLQDGRHGLLIDPGAWSNLVGERWVTEVAYKAQSNGYKPRQKKMDQAFEVQGVGTGTNEAKWEAQLPIAVSDENGITRLHEYHAPTVSGPGSELPALLGLESMSKQNGVLEMTDGHEYLTFPGPDGYKVSWSSGTRRYKLARAPSGHLILPCDSYQALREQEKKGGVRTPVTNLHANANKSSAQHVLPSDAMTVPRVSNVRQNDSSAPTVLNSSL